MPAAPKSSPSGGRIEKKNVKSIACQRCHSRKVRCSGGHPCANCREADKGAECVYPSRDRQIKLSQQYVEELLKENERLRSKSADTAGVPDPSASVTVQDSAVTQDNVQNPLIEDRPWFFPLASMDMPIHISEAADAAFATRFRQTLNNGYTNHIPRTSYISDEHVLQLSDTDCPWPNPARARFLVKVALNTVCKYYYMVRKSSVLRDLDTAIRNNWNVERLVLSKLFALFSLGEIYSTKTPANEASFPGLLYYAKSRRYVTVPAERPHMDTVEIILLLVVYSFALNRRHSAYSFASSSVRLATIMGMHLNIPEHQFRDRETREHRTRLWWSAYVLDRICVSKLGHPTSIHDDDIQIDLPSSEGLDENARDDFGDVDYILRNIELARLSTQVISSIYRRKKHRTPFSHRVQVCLKDLTKWVESLPPQLHLQGNGGTHASPHILYLHLTFNQCVILATRPVLLHVLRSHKQSWTDPSLDPKTSVPESALALSETCIKCARHSYRLLTEAWINGSFAIFDYFNTQYLFSAATILAISNLLGSTQSLTDGDSFSNAAELLEQLDRSGNFAANEYGKHLVVMKLSIAKAHAREGGQSTSEVPSIEASAAVQDPTFAYPSSIMTAGMALAEPSFQELLAEPNLNLQLFDNPVFDGMQTPYWPELWGEGWTAP